MSEPSKNNGNFGMSASGGHSPAAKSDLSLPDTNWLDAGAAILDNEGKVKKANLELENWLAIENAKIINRPLNELIKDCCGVCKPELPDLRAVKEDFMLLDIVCEKDEFHKCWLEFSYVRNPSGWTVFIKSVLPTVLEMTDEVIKQNLKLNHVSREVFIRMLRAEARLHNLISHWPGIIFSQRPDFTFSFVSPRIEEYSGIPLSLWKVKGSCFWEVVHEGDIEIVQRQLKNAMESAEGSICGFRIRNKKSGKVYYIHEHRQAVKTDSGLLLGYECVWLDITRQTIAERRLSSASWKEVLGVLTMGLAHDFSNVMSGIHGLSESFAANLEPEHPFREGLDLIKKSSMQASQIVHRIINLHHGQVGERSYHDLNQIIQDLVDLIRKIIPRRLSLDVCLASEQLPIYVDPVELRQVLINMTLNAVDAIPREGKISFKTEIRNQIEPCDFLVGRIEKFPAVCLWIEDTGHGIKPENLQIIFDPFFTTKPFNKGAGLGLYNAKLFVEKHHGAITIATKVNSGTRFGIWLPESDFTEAEKELTLPNGKRRTLLVVSSNDRVLETTAEFLRIKGFVAVPCQYKEKIWEIINSAEFRFSGVIFLMENPSENYGETIKALRTRRSDLKIIFQITGFNSDEYDTQLMNCSDLTIYPDMSENEIIIKLNELFSKEMS